MKQHKLVYIGAVVAVLLMVACEGQMAAQSAITAQQLYPTVMVVEYSTPPSQTLPNPAATQEFEQTAQAEYEATQAAPTVVPTPIPPESKIGPGLKQDLASCAGDISFVVTDVKAQEVFTVNAILEQLQTKGDVKGFVQNKIFDNTYFQVVATAAGVWKLAEFEEVRNMEILYTLGYGFGTPPVQTGCLARKVKMPHVGDGSSTKKLEVKQAWTTVAAK